MLFSPNKARFTGTPTNNELEQKKAERNVPFLLGASDRILESRKLIIKLMSIDNTGTTIPANKVTKASFLKVCNKFQIM